MAEHRIETSIDIEAPPARVWAVLTNFPAMAKWNPFIRSISGDLTVGGRLSLHVVPPGKSGMRFKPTVITLEPERELRWLGRLVAPGLFDGEHYFLLHPLDATRTRLVHGEKFTGLLVGPLRATLAATQAGFEAMNAALKSQAEGGAKP
jgi:hypothetical protein